MKDFLFLAVAAAVFALAWLVLRGVENLDR
jgi:hypothetical protein